MKHLIKLILISAIFLFIALWAVLYFFNDGSYFDLQSDEFSHFVAPVVTLLSVFLLIYTLAETKKTNEKSREFNKNQLALNEYSIYREEILQVRKELEELKFLKSIEDNTKFHQKVKEKVIEANGLNYIELFQFMIRELYLLLVIELSNERQAKKKFQSNILEFKVKVLRPLSSIHARLFARIVEIDESTVLNNNYKKKLFKRIEGDILSPYLNLCNKINPDGNYAYDLSVFDDKNKDVSIGFKEMNDYIFSHGLNQLHNKGYYQSAT